MDGKNSMEFNKPKEPSEKIASPESGGIRIEKPEEGDMDAISDLLHKMWDFSYAHAGEGIDKEDIEGRFKDEYSAEAFEKRGERLLGGSPNEVVYVAKDAGRVVGVCRAMIRGDKNEIQTLYVLPEYKDRGTAHELWDEVQKHLVLSRPTYVNIPTDNEKLFEMYSKLGFNRGESVTNQSFKTKDGKEVRVNGIQMYMGTQG